MLAPDCTHLPPTTTKSTKQRFKFVGLLAITEVIQPPVSLQTLQGEILHNTFHISHLKLAFVRGNECKISQTIQELRKNLNLENTTY